MQYTGSNGNVENVCAILSER